MTAQTSYLSKMAIGYAGQLQGNGPKTIDQYLVETAAGIAPGVVVSQGTTEDQCTLGGSAPVGVAIRGQAIESSSTNTLVFGLEEPINVISAGDVMVYLSEAGVKGAQLNYVTATGVIGVGIATSGELQLNAKLMNTITAAGYATIRLFEGPLALADGTTITGSGVTGDPFVGVE